MYTKNCVICGKQFETKTSTRSICYENHHHLCPVCGKDVISNDPKRQNCACSRKCGQQLGNASRIKSNMIKYGVENISQLSDVRKKISSQLKEIHPKSEKKLCTCVICGKQFEQKDFHHESMTCSSRCRGEYRRRSGIASSASAKAKRTIEEKYGVSNARSLQHFVKTCKWCGKQFETSKPRQEYCGDDWGNCPVCGNLVKIKDYSIGPQACSEECKKIRISETNTNKYGSPNVFTSDYGKHKSKETMIERYGVDHYSKTEEFKQKFESTMMNRYGGIGMQSEIIRSKIEDTNREKFGFNHPMQNPEIAKAMEQKIAEKHEGIGFASKETKSKIDETMISRYGTSIPMNNNDIRSRIEATNQERYGASNPLSKGSSIRHQIDIDNLQKYGGYSPFSSEEIRKNSLESVRSTYGVDNVFQSDDIKLKIRKILLERYGVDNPMKNNQIKQKAISTSYQKYGSNYYVGSLQHLESMMTDSSKLKHYLEFKENPSKFIHDNYTDNPTLQQIADDTGVSISTISLHVIQQNCQNLVKRQISAMEDEVVEYLYSICSDLRIIRNCRSVISPLEIDIFLPDINVGIECNPTYTHNSSFPDIWGGQPKHYLYHQNKSFQCLENNVFLFHIFGHEWTCKKAIIKSMLSNLVGVNLHKEYARNLKVESIPFSECSKFLINNHRQGSTNAYVRLGLINEQGEIFSVMTFNRLRNSIGRSKKNVEGLEVYELSRFCSKLNTSVVGGASKLFKYFVKNYHPKKVVSFSDVAHTRGRLYETLGFKLQHVTSPSYVWVSTKDENYLHRVSCQKNKLRKLFNDDNIDIENKTERQIMIEHGYVQVYDSGVMRWEYD